MDIKNICSFLHNGSFVRETFLFLFRKVTIYRWLLILLYAHMELIRNFDLLTAFGYTVVKSDFCFGTDLSLHHTYATCSEQPSHIKTMVNNKHGRNNGYTHRKCTRVMPWYLYQMVAQSAVRKCGVHKVHKAI